MEHSRIEIRPDVLLGKPVVKGSRVPVELIVRKLSEGASEGESRHSYPRLTREDHRACLAYAADVIASERSLSAPNE